MLAAVVIGFSRTFYLRAFFDVTDRLGSISLPAHLAMHGLVLTAWYALLLAQTSLVSLSRVVIHRRLGIVGIVIALCVIASGADTTFRFIPRALEAGTNPRNLVAIAAHNTSVLVLFGTLIAIAVYFRFRPAIHKRLMVLAGLSIIGPAFAGGNRPIGRFVSDFVSLEVSFRLYLIAFAVGIIALVLYDFGEKRKVHPATIWGGSALVLSQMIALGIESSSMGPAYVQWLHSLQGGS